VVSIFALDVGCGRRRLGDINVDIDRKVKPDIICDAHFLPFPDSTFDRVYCYHVLEHKGVKPEKVVAELLRVSRKWVEIQVPHWLSKNAKKDKTHANFQVMRKKWWERLNPTWITIDYTNFMHVPFLVRPNNITVILKKTNH
jgi:ubiquinone/menaquinone biosynthesis C-methylase UbiE